MVTKHNKEEFLRWTHEMSPQRVEEEPILRGALPVNAGGYSLFGRSRAAEGTGFAIPELCWAFDAGVVAHNSFPEEIFISHTHSDHVHELVHLKSRRKAPNIYVPAHAVSLVRDFLEAHQTLSFSRPRSEEEIASWTPSYHLHGVEPGDRIEIQRGSASFVVDVVGCDHSVPCVGYMVSEVRQKLKPELQSLSGREIGRLRQEGVEVSAPMAVPLFAYLGDTTTEVFARHPALLDMPAVIVECSFLDTEHDIERAAVTRHTSWAGLRPLVEAHPETLFVLIHFSLRFKPHEIRDFFAKEQQRTPLHNVLLWLS